MSPADFRRGTNYNHKMRMSHMPSVADEVIVAASLRSACDCGEHDETVVPANRVVYTGWPGNRRRETGERYCSRCGATIKPQA